MCVSSGRINVQNHVVYVTMLRSSLGKGGREGRKEILT